MTKYKIGDKIILVDYNWEDATQNDEQDLELREAIFNKTILTITGANNSGAYPYTTDKLNFTSFCDKEIESARIDNWREHYETIQRTAI